MKKFELFTLNNIDSPRFTMTPLELKDYLDFEVKRMYFILKPKTGESGAHCHYIEKELFVMIQGSCTVAIDQGKGIEEFRFEGPKQAIFAANYVWHGFHNFSHDAILLALSSTNYNPERTDYQENYEEYLKVRDEGLKA